MPKAKTPIIKTMTHADMEALVGKGFSFTKLHKHPNLIYRRTMLKRRQQMQEIVRILKD